jgi:hypothetical protein
MKPFQSFDIRSIINIRNKKTNKRSYLDEETAVRNLFLSFFDATSNWMREIIGSGSKGARP